MIDYYVVSSLAVRAVSDCLWGALDVPLRPLRNRHYLVIPELGLAYVRVPKAANSSIKHVFARILGCKRKGLRGINRDQFWRDLERARLVTFEEFARSWAHTYAFSFVRNPFDRLVSCYANKLVQGNELTLTWRLQRLSRKMTFAAFVRRVSEISDTRADNHFRSQWSILSHDGQIVPQFVGRIENMAADWRRLRAVVRERLGRDLGRLPHLNRTQAWRKAVAEYYRDPRVVELVRRRYDQDFANFYPELGDPGD